MLAIKVTSQFKKDLKKCNQDPKKDVSELNVLITKLQNQEPLGNRYNDHPLAGDWNGYRDAHVMPDWVLIYKVEGGNLHLARTGSHSRLFR